MLEGVVPLHRWAIGFSPCRTLRGEQVGNGGISCQPVKVDEPLTGQIWLWGSLR
jgi:hypothetical protein